MGVFNPDPTGSIALRSKAWLSLFCLAMSPTHSAAAAVVEAKLNGPGKVVVGEPLPVALTLTAHAAGVSVCPEDTKFILTRDRRPLPSSPYTEGVFYGEVIAWPVHRMAKGHALRQDFILHVGGTGGIENGTQCSGNIKAALAFPTAGRYEIRSVTSAWIGERTLKAVSEALIVEVAAPEGEDATVFDTYIKPHPELLTVASCLADPEGATAAQIARDHPRSRYVPLLLGPKNWNGQIAFQD